MKVDNESLWQQQVSALVKTDKGKEFLDFTETWCDFAESAMGTLDLNSAEALRITLGVAENKFTVRKTIGEIGHFLVVILGHWQYREDLSNELSEIEKRLVQDIVSINVAMMQEQAAKNGSECTDSDIMQQPQSPPPA